MSDSIDDLMKGLSFNLFKPVTAGVDDVVTTWELFYGMSASEEQKERFTDHVVELDKLEPIHAGIARYILQLGMIQSRQYAAGIPPEKVLELSSGLAGIAKREKLFPFTSLEKCAINTGKKIIAGEKIDYIETIINEISYLLG
jgi:hypothetical protein